MPSSTFDLSAYAGSGLQLVFFISFLTFIIFSLMLGYHTFRYSIKKKRAVFFFSIYLAGGALILIAMAITFYLLP